MYLKALPTISNVFTKACENTLFSRGKRSLLHTRPLSQVAVSPISARVCFVRKIICLRVENKNKACNHNFATKVMYLGNILSRW